MEGNGNPEENLKEELPKENNAKENNENLSAQEAAPLTAETEIANLKAEVQEAKDKYLRLLAESENTRKRMQKERQEFSKYAIESTVKEFLHPLDSLENALKFAGQGSDEVSNWAIGFKMILTQFKTVLSDHGFVSFNSEGAHFNPHDHEAVDTLETSDLAPGTIVQEFTKGYRVGERTIRHARVKVTKTIAPAPTETARSLVESEAESLNQNNQ